jgi:hypothetical protein
MEAWTTYFDDGQGVTFNRECETGVGGEVDDAEAIPLALNDVYTGTLDGGTSNVAPASVDRTGVGHLNPKKVR